MTKIAATLQEVRWAAEQVGIAELAREADVPYTTVKSCADRDWSNKNLDVLVKLEAAADRIRVRTLGQIDSQRAAHVNAPVVVQAGNIAEALTSATIEKIGEDQ
jgi:hypothetical protein